ncbi:alpha/beta hydrolase [Parvibaculum sp.]|uniref:alpha/beta hydrolase n=1 Tax=Parvibaculum sp. TaxID=2024848 RepID=UPI002D1695AB|nr:alpha/beta hydrolase [Parvibaculum sp.]HUD50145.1 alpha/beta hydrolase [Parvibaculum sp.]
MGSGPLARGRDRTLVLIHGMWSRPHVWKNFKEFFETRGYRVVTPLLRHHDIEPGMEPHPQLGEVSLVHYADDLETEIRALGCRPFVIGHSMGGVLAQVLAERGVTRGAALLASAHCAPVWAFDTNLIRIFGRLMMRQGFWKEPQLPRYDLLRWGALNGFEEQEARDLYASLIPESGRCLFELAFWYLDRNRAALVDAEKVSCPLLFITGAEDRLTSPQLGARTARYYGAKARFELKQGRGHWLPSEPGWEAIAARTAHFFENEAPLFDAGADAAEAAQTRWRPRSGVVNPA